MSNQEIKEEEKDLTQIAGELLTYVDVKKDWYYWCSILFIIFGVVFYFASGSTPAKEVILLAGIINLIVLAITKFFV